MKTIKTTLVALLPLLDENKHTNWHQKFKDK